MSRKKIVLSRPMVRPADGWILTLCVKCQTANYCPPGRSFCSNPAHEKEMTNETARLQAPDRTNYR